MESQPRKNGRAGRPRAARAAQTRGVRRGRARPQHSVRTLGGAALPPDALAQTRVRPPPQVISHRGQTSTNAAGLLGRWLDGRLQLLVPGPGTVPGTLSGLISLSGDGQALSAKLSGLLRSVSGKGTFQT